MDGERRARIPLWLETWICAGFGLVHAGALVSLGDEGALLPAGVVLWWLVFPAVRRRGQGRAPTRVLGTGPSDDR